VALLTLSAEAQTASSVSLVPSANPSTLGQQVTLTAAVTSGATGKVTFYDGTTVLGTSILSGSQDALDLNGDGKGDIMIYNSSNGASYTGISSGNPANPFTYQYAYWGNGKLLATTVAQP